MAKEKKFLDYEGVKHLWSKINMQDYPNNDMLMSVIQAIDETKLDKNVLSGNNELTWDGIALDSVVVDYFMHLVSYDIPIGFEHVINGKYAWNNGELSENNLFVFSGENYIGLSYYENPSLTQNIVALAILKDNTSVFDINYPISGFYMSGDPYHAEFISPLYYEWDVLSFKVNKKDLAQADWNQNDEIAPDYIKNRPFYEVPEIWTTLDVIDGGWKYFSLDYLLELDKPYTVRIDGVVYSFDCLKKGEYHGASGFYPWYLGAKYHPMYTIHWDYPFTIFSMGFGGPREETYIMFEDGSSNHTVEFLKSEGEIHHIDSKYIKDMYYTGEPVEVEILPEITIEDTENDYAFADNFLETMLQEGKTYVVTWNGEKYTCIARNVGDGSIYIGNQSIAIYGGECEFAETIESSEPFFIVSFEPSLLSIVVAESGSHVFSINVIEQELHQIHPKYIKDMYYEVPEKWTNIELVDDNWSSRATCKLISPVIKWAEDAYYKICVDGIEYEFDGMNVFAGSNATYGQDVYYIGAAYVPLNTNMNFEVYPFCLLTQDFINIYAVFADNTSNHNIEILESDKVIHYLDPKYLSILEKDYETVIETEVTDFIELTGPEYGKLLGKYAVVIDGVSEIVEFIDDGIGSFIETDSFAIESWTDPEGNVDNNGFTMEFANQDGNSHSVEIIAIKDVIKEEYLPDSVKSQADWNQNDPDGEGYIKNRPFYEEENIVNIAGLEYFVIDPMSNGVTEYTYDYIPLELGQTWDVCYNPSNNGNFTAGDYSSMPVQEDEDGNLYIGDPEVNTYPFYITSNFIRVNANWYSIIRMTVVKIVGVSGTYTNESIIHHLDPKYIKDMYYEEENILLEYKTNEPVIMVQLDKPNGFDKNKSYIFEVNGVEYKDVPSGTGSNNALGGYAWCGSHLNLNGAVWDETNYPFCFTRGLGNESIYISINDAVDFPVTFKLKEEEFIIHHLNPKYIKDMYYEEVIRTDITGESYTIDGLNASTLTVSHDPIPLKLGQIWEESHKHYSGNWTSAQTYEVQQADDGTLYLGTPISAEDNIVSFYLTENELSIEASLVSAGYGTFKFTCISGVTDESTIHKLDSKYLDIATDDEILEMLAEIDMLPVVKESDGSILADENENILLW